MLTPGEYVINASSARKIGYSNLNALNHMYQGGVVAGKGQRAPVTPGAGTSDNAINSVLGDAAMDKLSMALNGSVSPMNRLATALETFNERPTDMKMNVTANQLHTVALDGTNMLKDMEGIARDVVTPLANTKPDGSRTNPELDTTHNYKFT